MIIVMIKATPDMSVCGGEGGGGGVTGYSNFIFCSESDFISAIAFSSHNVYFNQNFVEVIT